MSSVENKDTLSIAFTGKLDNGTVFIDITPVEPMQVTIGESQLPPTVEIGIIGMIRGETRKFRVPPEEGYGPRLKDLLHEVPKNTFEGTITPKVGMILSQKIEKKGIEQSVPTTVMEVKEESVVLDYNHPLAGHHLTYDVTILEINKAS